MRRRAGRAGVARKGLRRRSCGGCSWPLWTRPGAGWSGENGVWVGAAEMNRWKGHNYLTVFADLEAQRVLLAVAGKDAGVWESFVAGLGRLFSATKRKARGDRSPPSIRPPCPTSWPANGRFPARADTHKGRYGT